MAVCVRIAYAIQIRKRFLLKKKNNFVENFIFGLCPVVSLFFIISTRRSYNENIELQQSHSMCRGVSAQTSRILIHINNVELNKIKCKLNRVSLMH